MNGQTLNASIVAKPTRVRVELTDALSAGAAIAAIIFGNILLVRAIDIALDALAR